MLKKFKPDASRWDNVSADKLLLTALGNSRLSTTLLGDSHFSSILLGDGRLLSFLFPSDFALTFSLSSLLPRKCRLSLICSVLLSCLLRGESLPSPLLDANPLSSLHLGGGEPLPEILFGDDCLSSIHLGLSSLHRDDTGFSGLLEHNQSKRNLP